jgi:hypothetical protein
MSARLEDALELLARTRGARAAGTIERVDVGKDGALELLERAGDGAHWWTYEHGALRERDSARDPKLALSLAQDELRGQGYELVAWRPGRRIVLRHPGAPAHLLKGYRSGRVENAVLRARTGHAACAAAGLRAPRVLDTHPQWNAYRMDLLPGVPLDLAVVPPERFFEIGNSLRSLQEDPTALSLHTAAQELDVVEDWIQRHERGIGPVPSAWAGLVDELRERIPMLPRSEAVLCHRDLHEGQILVSPSGVGLLDFDLLCRADACLDPANLIAHFALRALQEDDPAFDLRLEQCNQSMLEGLDRGGEPGFWMRLRYYQSASLLRLACVYALRPRWRGLSARLALLARHCLEECRA